MTSTQIAEAMDDLIKGHNNIALPLGFDPNGGEVTPPKVAQLVTQHLGNGVIDAAITDNSQIVKGVNYFIEYAPANPVTGLVNWTNPRVIDLGSSRNATPFILPNGTWGIRAYSQYKAGGPPSAPVYGQPVTVNVSNNSTILPLLASQSSGTGMPNTGGGHGAGKTISR